MNPQHVLVTQGFETIDPTITVRISDIAIMQAAQCSDNFSVTQKIYGVSKLFIAPEVLTNPKKTTGKADIYSIGVMLYALIANDLKEIINAKH